MPIQYPAVLDLKEEGRHFSWTERDTMLYALAIGMGADPLEHRELPFVYEKGLRAVPTFAAVAAWGAGIAPERIGLNRGKTLHGEEALIVHQADSGQRQRDRGQPGSCGLRQGRRKGGGHPEGDRPARPRHRKSCSRRLPEPHLHARTADSAGRPTHGT